MARVKRRDALRHLRPLERGEVLSALLDRHPELREEANVHAMQILDAVTVESMVREVSDRILGVGWEELAGRSGKQPWGGYVEPTEAAYELLQAAFEPVVSDMARRYAVGLEEAAERVCQGIVLGLYRIRNADDLGALANAPDFALESAGESFATLLGFYPRNRRNAVARRFLEAVGDEAEEWLEMLERVRERASPAVKRRNSRKRK